MATVEIQVDIVEGAWGWWNRRVFFLYIWSSLVGKRLPIVYTSVVLMVEILLEVPVWVACLVCESSRDMSIEVSTVVTTG